jgi:preprotein translocase subunit SecG
MNWVYTMTLVFHVLLAVGIVGLVLLQRGKGAEAGAGFGAGASGTVFGARGSTSFLSRSTAILATLFFVTSLALAYLGGRPVTGGSVMDAVPATTIQTPVPSEAQPREVEPPAATTVPPQPPADVPAEAPAK